MHGKSKPVTMPLDVQLQNGIGSADGSFSVKYQEWGMKNPSTFILRVNDTVHIHVHAVGKITTGAVRLKLVRSCKLEFLFLCAR